MVDTISVLHVTGAPLKEVLDPKYMNQWKPKDEDDNEDENED